ncbi:MAG TPA: DNA replication/repair protein RecF [Acidimicrobiia bacterium]|nr:DNA replication/repair protein RecF [Acidimicrobiia bacterium]
MRLTWLDLAGFRSYPSLHWKPDPGVNVIVGANGAGKTNLLEAIGYLATLRSLRGVGDDAVVRVGETAAVVRGEAERGDSTALIELEISARGRNRVLVNKRRPNRVSDLLGEVRAVTFLPDDLDLVKRGPAHRRQLLDEVAVQLAPAAALDQLEYDRALRQRNSLLRQAQGRDPDPTTLAVWDARMSQAGARVVLRRRAAMAAMTAHVVGTYEKLAGERTEIEMSYQTAWGDGGDETSLAHALEAALVESRRADRERRTTTVGPHRDEPSLFIGHRSARTLASQGEQRTLALSLRLAAFWAVADVTGERPLLLLDDVFSELDMGRAGALGAALPAAQVFVTTARDDEVPVKGRRWDVAPGRVS